MQDSCQSASRLRYTQVIKIEAVQSATRELSDQSASSFGHASVSGHSGTLLAKACRFNLLSMTQFSCSVVIVWCVVH